jgi:hypothetical protein
MDEYVVDAKIALTDAGLTVVAPLSLLYKRGYPAATNLDEVYDSFGKWMDEFCETAVIALRKTPQMMEKIGLVQR